MKNQVKSQFNSAYQNYEQKSSKSMSAGSSSSDGLRRLIITACKSSAKRVQTKRPNQIKLKCEADTPHKQFQLKELSVKLVRLTENAIQKISKYIDRGNDADFESLSFHNSLDKDIKDEPDFDEPAAENYWLEDSQMDTETEERVENNLEPDALHLDLDPDFHLRSDNSKQISKSSHTGKAKGRTKKAHIKCSECDARFYSKITQRRHIRAKHKVDIEIILPFACSTCKTRFYLDSLLNAHLKEQNGLCKMKPIPEYCSYVTGHGGGNKFKCNFCNTGFRSIYCVEKHYSIAHCKENRFICDACGIGLKSRYGLANHKIRCHYDGPIENHPYKCSHEGCNKIFANSNLLRIHTKAHRGEYEFLCTKCNYKAVTIGFLNEHYKQKHAKEFKCEQCAKCFSGAARLKSHILIIHTNPKDRPFPCKHCERSFAAQYPLRQHERAQHNHGEKAVECKICNAKFAVKGYLLKHMKKYHKEELVKSLAAKIRISGKSAGIY